ncbi:glycoside hydrolase family 76 protein, partial [Lophiostoma macrostomum CBS 122681]
WSTSATLWNALIAYSNLTSDTQFNDVVASAMYAQVGESDAYMPANQTKTLGNGNQTQWGLAALSASELGFPKEEDGKPGWLYLARNVFDVQTLRWNDSTCRGGLRDAIFTFNNDYNQMSSSTASSFFLLSSRLYKTTSNETYREWAEKQYTAATDNGLVGDNGTIVDYLDIEEDGCTLRKNEGATSESLGHWLEGAAVLFNATDGNQTWSTRVSNMKTGISAFTSLNGNNIDTD